MHYRHLRYPGGKTKAITFSFDDGCIQDLRLAQTLSAAGIKCTFNLNSCNFLHQDPGHISQSDVQSHILDAGHEVAIHGAYHKAPGQSRPEEIIRDVLDCRLDLEQRFGRILRGYAYPDTGITLMQNGADYPTIRSILQNTGILYARTLGCDNDSFALPSDWYAWMPTVHHANAQTLAYAKAFRELDVNGQYCAMRFPRLFYLWGHSYEFTDNWAWLDELCRALGGLDDVWYATNAEICEYVRAWDALVFSADGHRLFNPTLHTVWFDADGQMHCIAPGQTLTI